MRDQLVTETIDPRILRLVGLEEAFDLDYETYLVLLKEAQVIGKNRIPEEEQAILSNERKRVRGKIGRFKVKSKTIKAESITSVKKVGQRLLPGGPAKKGTTPIMKSLEFIIKAVNTISESISNTAKENKKDAEEERKKEENKKRKQKEESLETSTKKFVDAAKKLFSPIQGVFDKILNYFLFTFLGKGITTALQWFANPDNKDKINSIFKFVKDYWPTLLAAAAVFFTPLRGFIKSALGLIAQLTLRFPLITASVVGFAARQREIENVKPEVQKNLASSEKTLQDEKAPWYQKLGAYFAKQQLTGPRGPSDPLTMPLPGSMYASGGLIDGNTGVKITGAGKDTQLTALQPGEVVMNRAAVKAIGPHNLLAWNSMYGGANANKPKFAGNLQFAQNGGMVGKFMNWWNTGRNVRIPNESSANWGKLIRDDLAQRGQSDVNFARGAKPSVFGRPDRAVFARDLLDWHRGESGKGIPRPRYVPGAKGGPASAPTPAVRQAFERMPQYITAFQLGSQVHNLMEIRNRSVRNQQYGVGTVEDMMVNPQRYESAKISRTKRPSSPSITPSRRGRVNVTTLPPIVQSAGGGTKAPAKGTEIPAFSVLAPGNRRAENAQIYGLIP